MSTKITAALSAACLLAVAPASAQYEQDTQKKTDKPYDLMVGDPAPALAIDTWVKGDAIDGFAKDKVYVVEFWATWCGPCIHGMPHLSDLQEKYADKNVTIIGVNIWDEPEKVEPFMKNDAPIHKVPGDEIMRYTVAIETKDDPDDARNGVMAKTWMKAAGRGGIPSAFIVDQQSRVAWIGHPASMDDALESIVAGTWNLEEEATNYAVAIAAKAKIDRYGKLFAKGEYAKAYKLGHELVKGPLAKNAPQLNMMAWQIVDPEKKPDTQDLELALIAAERANELTNSKDAATLDTLAHVHADRGNIDQAIKFQKMAVEHAEGEMKTQLAGALKRFEKEAATRPASLNKGEAKKKSDG